MRECAGARSCPEKCLGDGESEKPRENSPGKFIDRRRRLLRRLAMRNERYLLPTVVVS